MTFGEARLDEAKALAVILSDWIDETTWMPKIHTPEEDERFLRHLITEKEVTVVRGPDGPQGFMARDGHEIHALYLCPAARKAGYGAALLNRAKTATDRIELWTFQANAGARAFYKREGFVEVEFTDGAGNDEKQPDVRLVWESGK